MKKILVTTDFSTASRAGIRFAMQLSTQMEAELVFFHCFQALVPTTIYRERIENEIQEQADVHLQKLEQFVGEIRQTMQVQAGLQHCVVMEHLDPKTAILDYARQHEFQFICMSTHGAGLIKKIIGTHTGWMLQHSSVAVLVVPHTYRVQPIKKVLYSSDLENFDREMAIVAAFTDDLQAKTDLAHFYFRGNISLDQENLAQMWRMKYPQLDQVYFAQYNLDQSFPKQLDNLTEKIKPSLVVFFTHTKKTWFDKVFGNSVSESASFVSKLPMLVCRK